MSKPAKKTSKKPASGAKRQRASKSQKPRILVLESAGGSATNAVTRSGALAVRVNPRDIQQLDEALAAKFDGLLLTGGGDVDPRLYGEKPHKQVYGVSETRDYADWTALERAYELGVPIMGICRGMQLIAIHNGGALKQHIEGHRGRSHLVYGENGSRFVRAIRHPRGMFVSLHHQIVRRHGGNGMRVSGRSREGFIEVIENPRRKVLGVQFHPEYDYGTNEESRRLFDWLAASAARGAGLPKPKRTKLNPPPPRRPLAPAARKPLNTKQRERFSSFWCCRTCGMKFDERQDRDDHEVWICGDGQMTLTEPPPGHPDWESHDDARRLS
jgi:putative glutamine amidotransferase